MVGVVNITEDSFSDGGRYLDGAAALVHARALMAEGAEVVELGPASSHPEARQVDDAEEIRRIAGPLAELVSSGVEVSIDSCRSATLRHAIGAGATYLNDVTGFADPALYAALAGCGAKLVLMHSVQRLARADRRRIAPDDVLASVTRFFEERLSVLENAGVTRQRIILDPGMGLFLGSDPEASYRVLASIGALRERFELPVMISVSRKSFLGAATGSGVAARGSATLAAELHAARAGADYIRTHDVRALADGLAVQAAIRAQRGK
ncbi:MAG: dihydropteroate synthase [Candidatus Binatia bacterium]